MNMSQFLTEVRKPSQRLVAVNQQAQEESTDPGQVQIVLLGKPEKPCSRETAYLIKGCCWGRSPTVSIWILCYSCFIHSSLQPPMAILHTNNKGHKDKSSNSTMLSANIRAIIYLASLSSIYSKASQECFPNEVTYRNLHSSIPMECLTWVEVNFKALWHFLSVLPVSCIDSYSKLASPALSWMVYVSSLATKDGEYKTHWTFLYPPKKEKEIYHKDL